MTGDCPPALPPVNHTAPVPRRIRATLAGQTVLDTMSALYVWEWSHYPQYYIPLADIDPAVLVDEQHEQKLSRGTARRYSLQVEDVTRPAALRVYGDDAVVEGLAGRARVIFTYSQFSTVADGLIWGNGLSVPGLEPLHLTVTPTSQTRWRQRYPTSRPKKCRAAGRSQVGARSTISPIRSRHKSHTSRVPAVQLTLRIFGSLAAFDQAKARRKMEMAGTRTWAPGRGVLSVGAAGMVRQDGHMTRGSQVRALAWGAGLAAAGGVIVYVLAGGPWAVAGVAIGAVAGAFAPSVYDAIRATDAKREDLRGAVETAVPRSWARLLDPRRELVGFVGRDDELASLMAWHEDDQAGRLRLVTGPGGVGKTRLAVELAERVKKLGWKSERIADGQEAAAIGLLRAVTGSCARCGGRVSYFTRSRKALSATPGGTRHAARASDPRIPERGAKRARRQRPDGSVG